MECRKCSQDVKQEPRSPRYGGSYEWCCTNELAGEEEGHDYFEYNGEHECPFCKKDMVCTDEDVEEDITWSYRSDGPVHKTSGYVLTYECTDCGFYSTFSCGVVRRGFREYPDTEEMEWTGDAGVN